MDHFLGLAFTLRKKGSYSNREKWNNGIYIVLENHDVCVEALKNNPLILWMMFIWSPTHSWDWDCGSKRLHKYIPWNIPWNIPRINNEEVGSTMNRLEGRNVVIEQSFGAPKVRVLG